MMACSDDVIENRRQGIHVQFDYQTSETIYGLGVTTFFFTHQRWSGQELSEFLKDTESPPGTMPE